MEDELEDKVIYQTYISHVKLLSKFVVGVPLNMPSFNYVWKSFRMYILKPEVLILGTIIFLLLIYLQAVDVWSRTLLGRLQYTLNQSISRTKVQKLKLLNTSEVERYSWELKEGPMSAYAVQGRRARMEDRFVINKNINNTGVSLLAVFDGHGGEFAANYAKEKLIKNLYNKVIEIKDVISGKKPRQQSNVEKEPKEEKKDSEKPVSPVLVERKKSFRKTASTSLTDECMQKAVSGVTDPELLSKLDNLQRPITREVRPSKPCSSSMKEIPATDYFDDGGKVNYGKLLTDEVLAADRLLVEAAKKNMDVAGTTALIALLEGSELTVANVGDSRGVMCDNKGTAIPLSFDHKPQQMRERKRIKEAGGFVTFNGVWRVAGILATSRALGDYPLKDKKLVIADPDILTFDLSDHKPLFIILASDGLWDTFSNEEAVAFIKERLSEADYGAKSITLQSYYRGSLDNITVLIINFKDNSFGYHSDQ